MCNESAAPGKGYGKYVVEELLGKGSSAKVYAGRNAETGEKVALKVFKKEKLEEKPHLHTLLKREMALMRLLDHPNIIKFHEVISTPNKIVLVLEYMDGGDMYTHLVENGKLDEEEALKYFRQLVAAVRHCHDRHVCHRDLKPENLLLSKDGRLVLADFGLSSNIKPTSLLATCCGSPHYVAPEVLEGRLYNGRQADMWACGVILYVLVTGSLPFDDDNLTRLMEKVRQGRFYVPMYLSEDCAGLIRMMVVKYPEARPSMQQVWDHSWFSGNGRPKYKEVEEKCKHAAQEVFAHPDSEVVQWLTDMGWGTESTVEEQLRSEESSVVKILYASLCHNLDKSTSTERKDRSSSHGSEGNEKNAEDGKNTLGSIVQIFGGLFTGNAGENIDNRRDSFHEPAVGQKNTMQAIT
ncbi:hypothetical protein NDN08_007968 [Rhodosorus marinus]|uniref:Protein kinase domain-containing protein n=1 Tax=Rhodosorus marinus TaxID=101924 RepID=A0AAV8UZ39_9RHOD|nr:hypothetical protein NDN08_007968 [Rhodosorus marinus]